MLNVVSFKPPKFKPMPSELTPAVISGATLPVKIGIAQRAIAACCDLSELLTWKDKLAALAAAAKMAKMPEMARDVNRVHKEAIFRMGEILLQYNGSAPSAKDLKRGSMRGVSERNKMGLSVGISKTNIVRATRIAAAPKEIKDRILNNDKIPATASSMAETGIIPRRFKRSGGAALLTDAALMFFSGTTRNEKYARSGEGLSRIASSLRCLDASLASKLTPEEKQRARKLVIEMQEILDDIDRRLGPAS